MRPIWTLLLLIGLAACGVAGPPVPPGSDIDPDDITAPDQFDPDRFFR